ncbi:MAG: hypothetical protein KDA81_01720 [Planctomycetaceae bacterium]|nr:hypothetical protein [Planctomycetaceae bacterium]
MFRQLYSMAMVLGLLTCWQCRADDYCVVVKDAVLEDAPWKAVADALLDKHDGSLVTYRTSPDEALKQLQLMQPRHTCFVAPHTDVSREFVAAVHQLTRQLDDDPYTDTFWGILTGFDAANALAIAQYSEPLIVRKVAAGTEIALDMCEQGLWYDELVKNKLVRKEKGGPVQQLVGPDDTTVALVNSLNDYQPDLFVTSGHATERDWQIGFRYRNGFFKSKQGQMFGEDTSKKRFEIESPNVKVYLPIGNCLMGHIDGPDAMALAWMNDAGVRQMIGYTVPTWFGYGGWGVLDYFIEQPGRYTLTEAFFANHQALLHALETNAGNRRGLEFDRDVVAFYGDPKWEARMAPAECAYDQMLTEDNGTYTFRITPNRGKESFKPINTNGSQRGHRPIVHWLPHRLTNVNVTTGNELNPMIADDFLLIPNPQECDPGKEYKVVFQAKRSAK